MWGQVCRHRWTASIATLPNRSSFWRRPATRADWLPAVRQVRAGIRHSWTYPHSSPTCLSYRFRRIVPRISERKSPGRNPKWWNSCYESAMGGTAARMRLFRPPGTTSAPEGASMHWLPSPSGSVTTQHKASVTLPSTCSSSTRRPVSKTIKWFTFGWCTLEKIAIWIRLFQSWRAGRVRAGGWAEGIPQKRQPWLFAREPDSGARWKRLDKFNGRLPIVEPFRPHARPLRCRYVPFRPNYPADGKPHRVVLQVALLRHGAAVGCWYKPMAYRHFRQFTFGRLISISIT